MAADVAAVRRFSRFYTRRIGVLEHGLLGSPFSLTEARVLYELAQREGWTAGALCGALGLDAGYLSRMLKSFTKQGLTTRTRAKDDGRQRLIQLTAAGRAAFGQLDSRSRGDVTAMLRELSPADRASVTKAMATIEEALATPAMTGQPSTSAQDTAPPFVLRPHRPGDMGWVTARHGVLYHREYGWDQTFEAMVARITAFFIDRFDATHERCWIAERGGEPVGCVFLVRKSTTVAQLRMLLVEPSARGLGLGRRLVSECLGFAHQCGYKKVVLWTNDILDAARAIYIDEGFTLTRSEKHTSFGKKLVGQTWELRL
jgi:DNA-binding MarR family transcriptional regulator/GNAT superfamily N-acetyltransferase